MGKIEAIWIKRFKGGPMDAVSEAERIPKQGLERRANILVRGVNLASSRKRILCLGEGRLRIFFEAKPCERMDEVYSGLKDALNQQWHGGVCAEVMTGGRINLKKTSVAWEN